MVLIKTSVNGSYGIVGEGTVSKMSTTLQVPLCWSHAVERAPVLQGRSIGRSEALRRGRCRRCQRGDAGDASRDVYIVLGVARPSDAEAHPQSGPVFEGPDATGAIQTYHCF